MARLFDGVDDRIDLANEPNFDFERTQPFSVACYWKANANTDGVLAGKRTNASPFPGWLFFQQMGTSNPRLALQLINNFGGGNRIETNTTSEYVTGTWRHALWTYDGSSTKAGCRIYVDSVSQTLAAGTDALSASILNNVECQIGALGGIASPGTFLDGNLADVAIWNVELDAVEAHMLGGGAEPSTIRGANQIALLRLCGTDSPEIDDWGTNDGTVTGTTKVDHPTTSPSACNPQPVLRTVTSNLRW